MCGNYKKCKISAISINLVTLLFLIWLYTVEQHMHSTALDRTEYICRAEVLAHLEE
jgi:hypothetical protein